MTRQGLYSSLKAFHYADRLDKVADGKVPAPVHIRIKPTNRCNHNCWYCAYRVDNLKLGEDMSEADAIPEDKMMSIVDDLIDMDVKAVTFSGGGEPLIYKKLPTVIERLGEAGIKIGCLTNGSNLQGKPADALAKYGTWVRISIDAWDDASYAKARETSTNAFSRMIENIRAFQKRGSDCELGVSMIIGKENHHKVYELCEVLKDAGVRHVKLSATVVSNNVAENNAYHEALMDAVIAQAEQAQALEDDNFKVVNHYHTMSDRFDKDYSMCPSTYLLTVIGADQKIYTCQDKAYHNSGLLGSIENMSFKEFWYSDENRERLKSIDPRTDCRHHCMSHAKNVTLWEYLNLNLDHIPFV